MLGVVAAWFDSTAALLELVAVLWLEFMSVDAGAVVDVAGGVAGSVAGAALDALVCELTGGVGLVEVGAAFGFAD